jgi:four helix bundle protein
MLLAKMVYQVAGVFPGNEQYGLTSQIKRSVVSIPSNIAEGAGRSSDQAFTHFLSIALGSAFELKPRLFLQMLLIFFLKSNPKRSRSN